jgi:predicted nuclease of predicted toxin-antitoxin system
MPDRSIYASCQDRHRYSQRKVEVVDVSLRQMRKRSLDEMEADLPAYLKRILLEHDLDAEQRLRERGNHREVKFISCRGLVRNQTLMEQMRRLLRCIQEEYENPVDVEFTINLSMSGEYSVDLLQCRPLQVLKGDFGRTIPKDVPKDRVLLESVGSSMGIPKTFRLDTIVYVDPVNYYNMPYKEKDNVAKLVGTINRKYGDMGRHMMLIVPGRVGTSSPELGVPTAFSDISAFDVICETEESRAGYNPELSYGSHIFQDLVEADILYTAIFANEKTLHFSPDKLTAFRNITADFTDTDSDADIIKVFDMKDAECTLFYDLEKNHLLLRI